MDSTSILVKCAQCLSIISDVPSVSVEQRNLCPKCGTTARSFEVEIVESVTVQSALGMKARHGVIGRPFYEAKAGADLHRNSGKWMERDLVVDRENDRYFERIVDPETGNVLHYCEEPLSKHQGHGTAKIKLVRDEIDEN